MQSPLVQITPAQSGLRFANFIIDLVCVYLVLFIVFFAAGVYVSQTQEEFDFYKFFDFSLSPQNVPIFLLAYLLYYLLTEVLFCTTPGKLVTHTMVVSKYGTKPSIGQLLGRTFARFIPFDRLSYFASDAVGWHDSISGTRVILREENQKASYG